MKKLSSTALLLPASLLLLCLPLAAQKLGPTVYGFGAGAPGPETIPRSLTMDGPALGSSPKVYLQFGNPQAKALLCYSAAPRYAPLPFLGADLYIDPASLLVTQWLKLDSNGGAEVTVGQIPNLRALTGLTVYAQFFEQQGSGLLQSTAFAAQLASGCTVQAQATGIVFGTPTAQAVYRGISATTGCTFKVVGQAVARPNNGVTITGRTGVGPNKSVNFTHGGVAAGTKVSIQLEVHCDCNGVVSQHFLFARGTK